LIRLSNLRIINFNTLEYKVRSDLAVYVEACGGSLKAYEGVEHAVEPVSTNGSVSEDSSKGSIRVELVLNGASVELDSESLSCGFILCHVFVVKSGVP